MRLIVLDSTAHVGEWSAKYVLKRIKDFNPGPDRYILFQIVFVFRHCTNVCLRLNFTDTLFWDYQQAVHRWACTISLLNTIKRAKSLLNM